MWEAPLVTFILRSYVNEKEVTPTGQKTGSRQFRKIIITVGVRP